MEAPRRKTVTACPSDRCIGEPLSLNVCTPTNWVGRRSHQNEKGLEVAVIENKKTYEKTSSRGVGSGLDGSRINPGSHLFG
jgi:hypothetical protein